jgi:hypothetical protein
MDNIYRKMVASFANNENLEFTDEEFIEYDKFINYQISCNHLIKIDEYNFMGDGFVDIFNLQLDNKIIELHPYDKRIDMRCKGQAAYFLCNNQIAVLTFSTNAITYFPQK